MLIAEGNTRQAAAHACGISLSTLQNWIAEFPEFLDRIKKADADAEIAMVNIIRTKARRSWFAAAWWLERRHPGRWGKNAIPDDGDEEKGPLEMGIDGGSDDSIRPVVINPGASLKEIRKGLGLDVADPES